MLHEYMDNIRHRMQMEAESMRRDFSSHRPSAGANKESIVKEFLRQHLPTRFGLSSGLVFSLDGGCSKEADILIVDAQNNFPFYGESDKKIWPAEAVYAMLEVKSKLTPAELDDAMQKGVRFKQLRRQFLDFARGEGPRGLKDSLFIIWAFESAEVDRVEETLLEHMRKVAIHNRPDLIIVPDKFVMLGGSLAELISHTEPDGELMRNLDKQTVLRGSGPLLYGMKKTPDALLAWFCYLHMWLIQAGARAADPTLYAESERDDATGMPVPITAMKEFKQSP